MQPGRSVVTVYRRKTPCGNYAYMVANYADGERRRFDSYASEADALAAADTLAKRLDKRDYVAASMTQAQAIEYANAVARLKPFDVTVDAATSTVAECLKTVADLSNLLAAVKYYKERHKTVTKKPVADVVAELLKIKESRGARKFLADTTPACRDENRRTFRPAPTGPLQDQESCLAAIYDHIRLYGHWSMDGLRVVKRDTREGGHRVPFLVCWPGHIPPGTASTETICHVDLMATCAALLGAKLAPKAGEDSCNILPALLGKKPKRSIRETTVLRGCNGSFALRQGDWVLIDSPISDNNGSKQHPGEPEWYKQERGYTANELPGELYNLRDDLPERRNLYAEKPEVVKRLKALLEKCKAAGRRAPGAAMKGTPASE